MIDMLNGILIPWLLSSALLLWVRIYIHLRKNDLSLIDALAFTTLMLIPVINLIYLGTSIYDAFSGSLNKIVIVKRNGQRKKMTLFDLIPAGRSVKIEIVTMGKYYAVRRSSIKLKLFEQITFLMLNRYSQQGMWIKKDDTDFNECLTTNLDLAAEKLVLRGDDVGTPVGGSISLNDLVPMVAMAKDDPGLTDLLIAAKEWYILKKPT